MALVIILLEDAKQFKMGECNNDVSNNSGKKRRKVSWRKIK